MQHKLTKQEEEVFRLIYKVFHTIQNRNGSLEMNKSVIAWGIEMKSFRKKSKFAVLNIETNQKKIFEF